MCKEKELLEVDMLQLEAMRTKVLEVARKAYQERLMLLTMGNFSARDPETGLVAITPSGRPYETMTPADICLVTLDGEQVDCPHKPSFETPMHLYVYRNRPNVFGVVHTHSPHANAFGLVGRPIPPVLVTQLVYVRGTVPVAPYQQSGTEEFGRRALEVMGDGNVVVLGGHGILAVGPDLDTALSLAVYTEEGARVYFLALHLGPNPSTLTEYLERGDVTGK